MLNKGLLPQNTKNSRLYLHEYCLFNFVLCWYHVIKNEQISQSHILNTKTPVVYTLQRQIKFQVSRHLQKYSTLQYYERKDRVSSLIKIFI